MYVVNGYAASEGTVTMCVFTSEKDAKKFVKKANKMNLCSECKKGNECEKAFDCFSIELEAYRMYYTEVELDPTL